MKNYKIKEIKENDARKQETKEIDAI